MIVLGCTFATCSCISLSLPLPFSLIFHVEVCALDASRLQMPRPKRTLGRFWPSSNVGDWGCSVRPRCTILHEGPAIPGRPAGGAIGGPAIHRDRRGEPRPYGRGNAQQALAAASDPESCRNALLAEVMASTSAAPIESRKRLWVQLSDKAALKLGGYRSAVQYMEVAKQEHIGLGHPWTEKLQQTYRAAKRSCMRGLVPAKQASALPMGRLAGFSSSEPMATPGPTSPARSTIISSWWMLRELEASRAKIEHLTFDHVNKTVTWLLPSSKTDVAALGASRKHSCACSALCPSLCPYHCVLAQVGDRPGHAPVFTDVEGYPPSKAGWANTFQSLAAALGLPVTFRNGARVFTEPPAHSLWQSKESNFGESKYLGDGAQR